MSDSIIDESVLSKAEWRILNAMSLHEYKKHRAKRKLEPLTQWQEGQLILQRIHEAVMSKECGSERGKLY